MLSYHYWKNTSTTPSDIIEEQIALTNQQKLPIVHAQKPEKGLLLYIADTHKKSTKAFALELASLSYYVAVIDNQSLLKAPAKNAPACIDIAASLDQMRNRIQQYYQIDTEELPIIVGDEEGASLAYSALRQTEKHHFHAVISINFSGQLNANFPLCHIENSNPNHGVITLEPTHHLPSSWYVFQQKNTGKHLADAHFTDSIGNAKLTQVNDLPPTNAEAIQILQWLDPRLSDQISSDNSDSDLPLIEVPVEETETAADTTDTLAVLLTGDGGWAEIDKNIAAILAQKGIPTIALDSLSYFWKLRTPEETAQDIETSLHDYLEKWHKHRVIFIGYSFGADVLPFIANKLSSETQQSIALVALLGMGKTAAFEFHLSSWMNADKSKDRLPLLPELEKMQWANSLCIYGVDDEDANCVATQALGVKVISMTGDHHFDEKYEELVQHIIDNMNKK